jgi:hypothetical protein
MNDWHKDELNFDTQKIVLYQDDILSNETYLKLF